MRVYAPREGRVATPSSRAGGIGLSVHNIRATDSYIRGSNGTSNGIVPMLRVYNDTARYVDQGGADSVWFSASFRASSSRRWRRRRRRDPASVYVELQRAVAVS